MRLFVFLAAICALSQSAMAQTPACKSITDPGDRLACYDKAAGPSAMSADKSARPKSSVRASASAPASKAATDTYVDPISAEDAQMNARMKNICRGC